MDQLAGDSKAKHDGGDGDQVGLVNPLSLYQLMVTVDKFMTEAMVKDGKSLLNYKQ